MLRAYQKVTLEPNTKAGHDFISLFTFRSIVKQCELDTHTTEGRAKKH